MKEFKKLTRVDEALRELIPKLPRMKREIVSVYECSGRVLAEDIHAPIDIPPFDRATMDGYAVRAEDTFGASQASPIQLKLIGKVGIGETPNVEIAAGEAVEIATGAAMPKGANAVVMVEYTRRAGDFVEVLKPVAPQRNVSLRGEDVKKGEKILKRGEILQPQDAGMLAACGIKEVAVYAKPRVAIISTGNELVEVGKELDYAKIYCSNDAMIANAVREFAEPILLGIARDEREEIAAKLDAALCFDAAIFTGGTSVGERDLVPEIVGERGEIVFHGVAMRPGMPCGAAVVDGKPVFMLPGSPTAAILAYYTIVQPALLAMMGTRLIARKWSRVRGRLSSRVASSLGVRSYVRVLWDGKDVYPVRASGSGIISSMIRANALLVVPEDVEGYEEGEEVEVTLIRDITEVLE